MKKISARTHAVHMISDVIQGQQSLSQVLNKYKQTNSKSELSLIQELVFGVLRWGPRLQELVAHLVTKPVKSKDKDIEITIMLGLYQLINMRVPAHAAVATAVDVASELNKKWAKGFINAILRAYQQQAQGLAERLTDSLVYEFAHPQWLINKIKTDWPADYQMILNANNQKPEQWLRVNQLVISVKDYQAILAKQNIYSELSAIVDHGLRLQSAVATELLPGFGCGQVSVQDGASQLPVKYLDLQPGQDVLDACAAPGGKTAQILETCPDLASLSAYDKSQIRLQVLRDNLQRLDLINSAHVRGCALTIETANVVSLSEHITVDTKLYDRILLDAPCSATGVIRRHPDIKYLRRQTDIEQLQLEQRQLLNALWKLLKPGGLLLYSTCSVFADENQGQIKEFLLNHSDAQIEQVDLAVGRTLDYGYQILPGDGSAMDGFYFARIRRITC